MSTSAVNFPIPPEVSGAHRYERVAQLEAVLTLRDKNRRVRFRYSVVVVAVLLSAAVVVGTLLMRFATG